MVNKMNCFICQSNTEFISHAVVAPWISELFGTSNNYSKLYKCLKCDFIFFDVRYNDRQMELLYKDYRGENYLRVRKKWEPWYSQSENSTYEIDVNPQNVTTRKLLMSKAFRNFGVSRNFENCLDFGGDSGQFFPENVKGKKFLLDPSSKQIKDSDISIVHDLKEIVEPLDLILNSGVLEHINRPKEVVFELINMLAKDGILYIEVPLDNFKVHVFHKTNMYRKYLKLIQRTKIIFVILDFLSGAYRRYFRTIPFFGIVKQSEHINYFGEKSLTELVAEKNLDFRLTPPDYEFKHGKLRMGHLSLLVFNSNYGTS